MKSKKDKITAPQLSKIFKDLAAKKNPRGGAQPGALLSSAGKLGEKSCGGDKGCGAKLGA
jgi:hypothetical protein